MPIVRLETGPILRCVNHEVLKEGHEAALVRGSTMRRDDGLAATLAVETRPAGEVLSHMRATIFQQYFCAVCGYVELYANEIVKEKRDG